MDDLTPEFERIKQETGNHPWITKFSINGSSYGGDYSYLTDPRVSDFLNWVPATKLTNILELASCEGGQSLEILKSPYVHHLTGLDGKPWLVERATKVFDLLGISHATFAKCNFDTDQLPSDHFDSCFCANVLYHLIEPWKLIERLNKVCDYLYLATHYTLTPNTTKGGYRGRVVPEPKGNHAWAGIADHVFWLSLPEIIRCLLRSKWDVLQVRNWPQWDPPRDPLPEAEILCKRR